MNHSASTASGPDRSRALAIYWSVFLAYTVLVILWGAFVRATGSGAGCGDHWPLCNGQVIPRSDSLQTLIEFGHRVTSGFAWLGALAGWLWTRRAYRDGVRPVRRWAFLVWVLMSTEALVGAGLVVFEMVAQNTSVARGVWVSAHLTNTFLLVAAMTHTTWCAWNPVTALGISPGRRVARWIPWLMAVWLVAGITGAIAALGDTLFPATSLAHGLQQDVDSASHLFLRLRLSHPVFAILAALLTLGWCAWLQLREHLAPKQRLLALGVCALVTLQIGLGFLNVILLAPIWLQLVHLALADGIWIATLWLGASLRLPPPIPAQAPVRPWPA